MGAAADFTMREGAGGEAGEVAELSGDWTATEMAGAAERLEEALKASRTGEVDLTHVGRCDTSGAYRLLLAGRATGRQMHFTAPAEIARLLDLVAGAVPKAALRAKRPNVLFTFFDRLGRGVVDAGLALYDTLVFNGHLLITIWRAVRRPRRIRWAAVFALAERAGLDAAPVVVTTTFFIGAVVGLIGTNLLSQFGAQV
ncbi:MAG: STAS domain-containing protein, partial [Caulobacteraceae bacterium]